MAARESIRLGAHLPAIYRTRDAEDDLSRLLGVFEELLFTGNPDEKMFLPGIEQQLDALPFLFAPLGAADRDQEASAGGQPRTPDAFMPWLASWLAFAPYRFVDPARLRHVVAGIVPLHGRRGTRAYLEELLRLCFDEIDDVRIDEHGRAGLRIGASRVGVDTLLAEERPFWFSVEIDLRGHEPPRLEQRVRAVVEFSKPAHTAYELRIQRSRGDGARVIRPPGDSSGVGDDMARQAK